ncbi:DUF1697 domain-containing protein [Membranihabitans maritimus]|uniref:DUF1697 domain-containing protein n=1 Tax=Membranihabitans maritimus TaxID=2904244 RepID=UPI001F2A7F75|nr:DUF1697 domain-containing protein [Membranihabitans maritimus]
MEQFAVFLRGINVGGNKKVPMEDLKKMMTESGFEDVETLLNSGNILFFSGGLNTEELEGVIEKAIEQKFGFFVPVIARKMEDILGMISQDPFSGIEIHKKIRLYVSFVKEDSNIESLELPWISEDNSYRILEYKDRVVYSVLDLTGTKTTKAMEYLDKLFGKFNVTTRNWNTILKMKKKSIH